MVNLSHALVNHCSDKDGKLALSAKQRSNFVRWKRPDEITGTPQMIIIVSSFSIKQVMTPSYEYVIVTCKQVEVK